MDLSVSPSKINLILLRKKVLCVLLLHCHRPSLAISHWAIWECSIIKNIFSFVLLFLVIIVPLWKFFYSSTNSGRMGEMILPFGETACPERRARDKVHSTTVSGGQHTHCIKLWICRSGRDGKRCEEQGQPAKPQKRQKETP